MVHILLQKPQNVVHIILPFSFNLFPNILDLSPVNSIKLDLLFFGYTLAVFIFQIEYFVYLYLVICMKFFAIVFYVLCPTFSVFIFLFLPSFIQIDFFLNVFSLLNLKICSFGGYSFSGYRPCIISPYRLQLLI